MDLYISDLCFSSWTLQEQFCTKKKELKLASLAPTRLCCGVPSTCLEAGCLESKGKVLPEWKKHWLEALPLTWESNHMMQAKEEMRVSFAHF